MAVTDRDVATAVVIALLIIAFAVCVWPGLARVRGRDLVGYWVTTGDPASTALYEIRDAGGRAFEVVRVGDAARAAGHARFVRGVSIPALGKTGSLELGGRHIDWVGGDVWVRQGVGRQHFEPM